MNILTLLFFFALHPFGYSLLRLFRLPATLLTWSVSWLIGSSVLSVILYGSLVTGTATSASVFITVSLCVIGAILALHTGEYRQLCKEAWLRLTPQTPAEKIVFASVLGLLVLIMTMNQFWPHTDWDALTLYDFRAQEVLRAGKLSPLVQNVQDLYFLSYPWYTSGLFVFAYALGSWNVMGVYSFLCVAFLYPFYVLLSEDGSKKLNGMLAALSLLTVPIVFSHTMIAYTNFPFMAYWGIGIVLMLYWIEKRDTSAGVLGIVLVGLSSWVRASEPFWLIGVLPLLFGIVFRQRALAALWLPLLLLPKILWKQYVGGELARILPANSKDLALYHAGASLPLIALLTDWSRWGRVFMHLTRFVSPLWGSWLLLIGILLLMRRNPGRFMAAHLTISAAIGMIVVGTFVFSSNTYWDQIIDSFQRLLLFLFPVLVSTVYSNLSEKKDI